MCFIKDWLNTNGMEDFTAQTIAEASDSLFSVQLIGTSLRNLTCSSIKKYPTINGKRTHRNYWNAESVYSCYHTWGIPAWHLNFCHRVIPVETENLMAAKPSNPALSDKTFKIMVGSAGHVTTPSKRPLAEHDINHIDYYSSYWKQVYPLFKDYRISYSFINNLNPILLETFNSRAPIWLTENKSKCLEMPSQYIDKDGYPLINQPLLNKLNLDSRTYNINYFPARGIHRLVCMVNHPTLDWHLPRQPSNTYVTAHHTCFNKACINQNHLKPMTEDKHTKLHNDLKDAHAYNDPAQHLQVEDRSPLEVALDEVEIDFQKDFTPYNRPAQEEKPF